MPSAARYNQTPGVIALGAGIDFINKTGINRIYSHERELCKLFINEVSKIKMVKLYHGKFNTNLVPIVPFNVEGVESFKTANILSEAGFCLRGGLHCSFLAHKKLNTLETGVVRFAPSVFNTKREVLSLTRHVKKLAEGII
ncbi:MAG: aminotransferase class V-fold PLP-dependent enzyme [Oscillospiraceae bacterium]|nr:aminotransferase class V-fold PLP-dependent enzyme [Oscillospiraceae bacterium]